jgi:hypothetical protein
MVDLVSLPVISVLHLVGIPSLFDASANTVSSVCSCFDYQLPSSVHDFAIHRPHRHSSSLLTSHISLRPSTSISLQPSTFINFNFDLQPRPSSRISTSSHMVCWLGVSWFRKMRNAWGLEGSHPIELGTWVWCFISSSLVWRTDALRSGPTILFVL